MVLEKDKHREGRAKSERGGHLGRAVRYVLFKAPEGFEFCPAQAPRTSARNHQPATISPSALSDL
jgi:hypothetical protein